MKRMMPKKVLSIFCCSAMLSGAFAPAFAQVNAVHLPGGVVGAPGAAAAAATNSLANPALTGGVPSITGSLTAAPAAGVALPSAAPALAPAALPAASLPISAAPLPPARAAALPFHAAAADAPKAPGEAPEPAKKPADSLGAAKDLSGQMTPGEGDQAGGDKAAAASNQAFDGAAAAPAAPEIGPAGNNGTPLNRLYPKVVFIQDVFSGPAPDAVAGYVNRLIDAGVHVVFMTWRPQKGPGSADEVLLSRVKQSRANPVVVVAFNGGKIALHGRAANPKAIMENVGQFSAENLAKIKAIAEKIGAGGAEAVTASPADNEAFSLNIAVDGASRGEVLKKLNAQLKSAGLPYKAELHQDNANALIVHSMPLRFSLPRVLDALETQFPGENLTGQPEKYLVVADSMKSLRFSTSFPKEAEIQVASDGAAVGAVLGATLGDRRLETIAIKLGKLRQYAEFWEPSRHYVPSADSESRGGGGGSSARPEERQTSQMLSMFVGTVINRLMAKIYENIRNGQHQFTATPWALQKQLEAMWHKPIENGVYVNKKLALALARTPADVKRGYMEKASAYVSNFYSRELANYPAAAAHVELNLVSLNTDRKSSIMLEFKSSSTGKIYKIYTRIPRVMRQRTGEGVTLTAYGYRTGKETADEGEEFLSRMYALALLKGHARKGPDGKWHQGTPEGPVITKMVVQFERHTSARIKVFNASDFDMLEEGGMIEGAIVRDITSAIERMEADAEYQQYYKEHEEEATKEDMKKPVAAKKPAARPAVKSSIKTGAKLSAKDAKRVAAKPHARAVARSVKKPTKGGK
ncbi:MAG: hypothetical protein ACHQ51_12535 [Elusimicrobiota bacterium]